MAHFYGSVVGSRGEASRLGGKDAGMCTVAASHAGAVRVTAFHRDGVDMVRVQFTTWQGRGVDRLIYEGPINGSPSAARSLAMPSHATKAGRRAPGDRRPN